MPYLYPFPRYLRFYVKFDIFGLQNIFNLYISGKVFNLIFVQRVFAVILVGFTHLVDTKFTFRDTKSIKYVSVKEYYTNSKFEILEIETP